jgi:hypothetical protein
MGRSNLFSGLVRAKIKTPLIFTDETQIKMLKSVFHLPAGVVLIRNKKSQVKEWNII